MVMMALSLWCWKTNSESQTSFIFPKATSMDESLGCFNARTGFSYSLNDFVMPVPFPYLLGRTHGISSVGDPICLECHVWFWWAKWHLFIWLINCCSHYLLQCLLSFYKPQDRAHIHLQNEIGHDSNSEGISVECKRASGMNTIQWRFHSKQEKPAVFQGAVSDLSPVRSAICLAERLSWAPKSTEAAESS